MSDDSALDHGAARPITPVGIASALLTDVADRLVEGGAIEPSTLADLRRARDLVAGLDDYLAHCTTPESPALTTLAARTRDIDWAQMAADGPSRLEPQMLSGHVEGRLLAALVRACGARRVLDIGMFTGYSALAMAEALPDGGRVVALELDRHVAAIAREAFDESEHGHKIVVEVGPAMASLERLAAADAIFDVAFLDADKPGYTGYLEGLLDTGLMRDGGLIVADNTLLAGEPYAAHEPSPNGRAIAAFNRAVADDPRVEQVLVPLRDGVTIMTVLAGR